MVLESLIGGLAWSMNGRAVCLWVYLVDTWVWWMVNSTDDDCVPDVDDSCVGSL